MGLERFKGGGCGHLLRQAVPINYGVWEMQGLPVVCLTIWHRVGEWMGPVGSSDSGLLGWCILAVDGDQSKVKLVEAGESGMSASGLQGWRIQCCQHVIQ